MSKCTYGNKLLGTIPDCLDSKQCKKHSSLNKKRCVLLKSRKLCKLGIVLFVRYAASGSRHWHMSLPAQRVTDTTRKSRFRLDFGVRLVQGVIHFSSADPSGRRSKAWVYSCSLAGFAGSNPAGGMDVCLLWAVAYRGGVGGFNPPPSKFRSFDKVEPDCKLSEKCVFLFQHLH